MQDSVVSMFRTFSLKVSSFPVQQLSFGLNDSMHVFRAEERIRCSLCRLNFLSTPH